MNQEDKAFVDNMRIHHLKYNEVETVQELIAIIDRLEKENITLQTGREFIFVDYKKDEDGIISAKLDESLMRQETEAEVEKLKAENESMKRALERLTLPEPHRMYPYCKCIGPDVPSGNKCITCGKQRYPEVITTVSGGSND